MFNGLHEKVGSVNGIFRNLETKWEICEVRTSHALSDSPFLLCNPLFLLLSLSLSLSFSLSLFVYHMVSLSCNIFISHSVLSLSHNLSVYISLNPFISPYLYLSLYFSLSFYLSVPLCRSLLFLILSPLRHLNGFLI